MRNFFLKNLWNWKCGLPENKLPSISNFNLNDLSKTEWSSKFEKLMRNRMIMGSLRYGRLNSKGKPQYNRIDSCHERLKLYEQTGNVEYLVDVANLCQCEFVEGEHPKKHFKSIDDKIHVKRR